MRETHTTTLMKAKSQIRKAASILLPQYGLSRGMLPKIGQRSRLAQSALLLNKYTNYTPMLQFLETQVRLHQEHIW